MKKLYVEGVVTTTYLVAFTGLVLSKRKTPLGSNESGDVDGVVPAASEVTEYYFLHESADEAGVNVNKSLTSAIEKGVWFFSWYFLGVESIEMAVAGSHTATVISLYPILFPLVLIPR